MFDFFPSDNLGTVGSIRDAVAKAKTAAISAAATYYAGVASISAEAEKTHTEMALIDLENYQKAFTTATTLDAKNKANSNYDVAKAKTNVSKYKRAIELAKTPAAKAAAEKKYVYAQATLQANGLITAKEQAELIYEEADAKARAEADAETRAEAEAKARAEAEAEADAKKTWHQRELEGQQKVIDAATVVVAAVYKALEKSKAKVEKTAANAATSARFAADNPDDEDAKGEAEKDAVFAADAVVTRKDLEKQLVDNKRVLALATQKRDEAVNAQKDKEEEEEKEAEAEAEAGAGGAKPAQIWTLDDAIWVVVFLTLCNMNVIYMRSSIVKNKTSGDGELEDGFIGIIYGLYLLYAHNPHTTILDLMVAEFGIFLPPFPRATVAVVSFLFAAKSLWVGYQKRMTHGHDIDTEAPDIPMRSTRKRKLV
jgi:hypothetical protein